MGIEAILAIAGLVVPPVTDFVKKKFLKKGSDTVEATASTLATTAPERLPEYISSMSSYLGKQIEWFNRDVIGQPSTWVVDLRAAIRPISVIASLLIVSVDTMAGFNLDENTRAALLMNISSWFGSRLNP